MARYHYTRENENGVVLYLESEPAEDAMDEFDDEIAVGFSGNGYLSFWTRCRRAAEALPNGLKYAAGGKQSFPKAEGTSRWLLWMLRRSTAGQSTE